MARLWGTGMRVTGRSQCPNPWLLGVGGLDIVSEKEATGVLFQEQTAIMQGYDQRGSISVCRGLGGRDRQMGWLRAVVVLAALFGLFVARSVPTTFASASSTHSVVYFHSSHDQRPRFDNLGSQWSIPITTFAETPPPSVHAGVSLATALVVPFRKNGTHHTRPPPRS